MADRLELKHSPSSLSLQTAAITRSNSLQLIGIPSEGLTERRNQSLTWLVNIHSLEVGYGCPNFSWSKLSESEGISTITDDPWISFCLDLNLSFSNNEFVITPIELKPMRAPAIDGVSIVPVDGSRTPAATGIPTCWSKDKEEGHSKKKLKKM